jgi:uncharacterized protein (DUF2164 family)
MRSGVDACSCLTVRRRACKAFCATRFILDEGTMAIKLEGGAKVYLLESIKRFFADHMDEPVGDLKAALVLDFCLKEIGPTIYNQAIADAQIYFQERAADLTGTRYEAEFDYWKK